jgi:hypothetical protein
MEHQHKTHEEVRECALSFGECWQNPKVEPANQNNLPNGKSLQQGERP